MQHSTIHKILIVGPLWIGDMVMSHTLYQLLKKKNPEVEIDVLAPEWTKPLLDCMPEVHQAIAMPFKHGELGLVRRHCLARTLRFNGYQQAIILPNSLKSALIPFFAKIPKRTGWRGEMRYGFLNDLRILDKKKYPLMIERFMALGLPKVASLDKPYPLPHFSVNENEVHEVLQALNLSHTDKPLLTLCPGAQFGPSKQWPPDYFAVVARHYLDKGFQVWIFGSAGDKKAADKIQSKTNHACVNLAGVTNLRQAIHLLSLSRIVVTNDSGLMHIAAALDVPLVAIYGSSSPAFTPPLGEHVNILSTGIACSPCFKRVCPLKHWRCMLELKPQLVINALKELERS